MTGETGYQGWVNRETWAVEVERARREMSVVVACLQITDVILTGVDASGGVLWVALDTDCVPTSGGVI